MNYEELYEKVCKPAFDEVLIEIRDMKNKLFIDNGDESVQSRLNRHERIIKVWCWLVGIIGTTTLAAVTTQLIRLLVK
jgi:hypothetical protein